MEIAPSFSDIEQENPSPSGKNYITLRLKLILFDIFVNFFMKTIKYVAFCLNIFTDFIKVIFKLSLRIQSHKNVRADKAETQLKVPRVTIKIS